MLHWSPLLELGPAFSGWGWEGWRAVFCSADLLSWLGGWGGVGKASGSL